MVHGYFLARPSLIVANVTFALENLPRHATPSTRGLFGDAWSELRALRLENPEGAKFCDECSAPLGVRCPACGISNRPAAKFCHGCASALVPPPVAKSSAEPNLQPQSHRLPAVAPLSDARDVEGERRHLTVLFCDLVGSTGIAAHLDPEDWREMVGSYHGAAKAAVDRFDGYLAQSFGDGLLVYFGYPQAHEDDPHRAVLAGLAILEAVAGLNRRFANQQRPRLAARLGIHVGSVVVGESSGKGANVFGDVPNVASRVQTAAAPDSLVITAAVHQLVSGMFVVEDQGEQPLKGVEHPVRLYRVLEPSGVRDRLAAAAAARGLTPFIGREEELRLILHRWDQVRENEGQVILVAGEAGIGKSRLVQRFHEQIVGTPHTWVDCAAAALHQNTPFYAIADMLQQSFRWRGEQSADERIAGLEASLELAGVKLNEALPLIAPLLNLPIPAKYPPLAIAPEQQRKRLLATIIAWAVGTARRQPLVIAVEDLHWADPSTLEALQLLAEQGATAPLLVICTARPEFHASWPLRAHHTQLTLNRLGKRDVREMVGRIAAGGKLAPGTVEALVERSGGVPLFAEELTRTVLESGATEPALRQIPATLHDSLMERLDRLGGAREIAQVASVIGHEFSWELLKAVVPIEDQRLEAELKKLSNAELLSVQGIPPEASYRFRHALIQDAAYQSLLRSKRQQYDRQIAQVLEERFPEVVEAQPQLLAHHYTEADLKEQAIPHWQTAGQKAVQRSANAEAVSHFSKALELLNTMPESHERFQQELAFQLAVGTPLIATKGFGSPEVGTVYARARQLCEQAGEAPQLFPVLWGLWVFYTARAEHTEARKLAEQCLRLAETTRDPDLLVEAHHALGVTLTAQAEFATGTEHLEHVIAHHDPSRQSDFPYGQDPKVVCLSQAAWTLWIHGNPGRALKLNDEAIRLARKLGHPYSLAAALSFGAMVYQLCQNAPAAQEHAEAAIALSTEQEFAYWAGWSSVLRGWALTQRGQLAEGIVQIREGVAAFRATGAEVMVPYFMGLLAHAYGAAGQPDQGLSILSEALAAAEKSSEHWWEVELYRLKGELTLMQSGDRSSASENQREAEGYFRQALEIASRQSAHSLELRAAMSLSRMWQKQGKNRESHRLLLEVYGRIKEGVDTADLHDAKTLLEEVS
jgi:class 3 adenylate cyclase/predicted ATPase